MKKQPETPALSRRERQVMDILHKRGEATVAEIMGELPDPPTYSAVRSVLRILGEKQLIRFKEDGPRYVYLPVIPSDRARRSILKDVVKRLFNNSTENAVAALLESSSASLSDDELERLERLISSARRQGR